MVLSLELQAVLQTQEQTPRCSGTTEQLLDPSRLVGVQGHGRVDWERPLLCSSALSNCRPLTGPGWPWLPSDEQGGGERSSPMRVRYTYYSSSKLEAFYPEVSPSPKRDLYGSWMWDGCEPWVRTPKSLLSRCSQTCGPFSASHKGNLGIYSQESQQTGLKTHL